MKKPKDSEFVELKVYKNKKTNQRTLILPKRKMKNLPIKVKFFPKLKKIKW